MLRDGQSKMMENMSVNAMNSMPGFDAMKAQQEAFMKAFGWPSTEGATSEPAKESKSTDDLDAIKAQLSALQEQLSKMGK
jgi:polyhydroxyalkanoate synthesis regulator protein